MVRIMFLGISLRGLSCGFMWVVECSWQTLGVEIVGSWTYCGWGFSWTFPSAIGAMWVVMKAPVGWRCLVPVLGLRCMVDLVVTMSLFGLHFFMERVRSSSCTESSIHISSARATVHLKYWASIWCPTQNIHIDQSVFTNMCRLMDRCLSNLDQKTKCQKNYLWPTGADIKYSQNKQDCGTSFTKYCPNSIQLGCSLSAAARTRVKAK